VNPEQHPSRLDGEQPADPSQFDVTQPARPVKPDNTPPAQPSQQDVTQPMRPIRPGVTQPARPAHTGAPPKVQPSQFDVTQRARPIKPAPAPPASHPRRPPAQLPRQQPRPPAQRVARPRPRPSRRRWRRYLLPALALALTICLGGLLVYGLLLVPSPTNILILGIDRRPGEGNAVRTDTILLLHADPANRRLVLLSIPRDLWITIPGQGEGRINTAHVFGELESPGNGPLRAAEAVSYNFGVPVDHTLRLDFDAFREVIDAAGGIEIDVPTPLVDNAYPTADYGTMRIEIPAGLQHMDGETALQYARSRHSSSDFDRAARQQQIFVALIKKLLRPSGWFLIPRAYEAFQNAVETNLSVRDMARLALAWQRAGEDGIERIVIDREFTTPFRTAQGAAVLLPRWELIQPLVQAQFTP
jgi:LCP family protein required for cell wall assembly